MTSPSETRGRLYGDAEVDRRLQALTRALHAETERVNELNEHLRRQRAGVAADDIAAVDDSVDAIGRVLHALEAARSRRTALVFDLCGDEAMPLERLSQWLGDLARPDFDAARTALRNAASATTREAAINRAVLERVTANGEAFLQELFSTVAMPESIYGPNEPADAAGGPVLLNRRA